MDFAFCWQFKECSRECAVRERRMLFCWRYRCDENLSPRPCDNCDYRLKWVRGEFSVDAFVALYNRRTAPRTRKKVLVVEDDPSILYALEEAVRYLGFDCVSACDGEEGLILARGIKPDLIITDLIMPKVDGFQLCSRLREESETRKIPVIVVTGRDRKKDRETGASIEVEAYLVKPFRSSDLTGHISRLLPQAGTSVCRPALEPAGGVA